jgi:hypothetical protein
VNGDHTTSGADIFPDNFLLPHRYKFNQSSDVCKEINIVPPHSLEVKWWICLEVGPPLCPRRFQNLHHGKAQEVVPCVSSSISHDAVVEIAFVFSNELL